MEKFWTIIDTIREQLGAWISKVSILLLLSFLFFIAVGGVSHNVKWQITRVNITGERTVSEDVVRSLVRQRLEGNYFFVYARDNSHLFAKTEIEQMLRETFPRLENVSVDRIDDHALSISLSERKPYALWCGAEFITLAEHTKDCWFIDEDGFVFDHSPIFSDGVYMEVYGKLIEKNMGKPLRGTLSRERFTKANSFLKLIREQVGEPMRIGLIENNEIEIIVHTSIKYPFLNDVTLRLKDESDSAGLIKNLLSAIPVQFPDNIALKKKLLYVDMRFGNKVIFGFEN